MKIFDDDVGAAMPFTLFIRSSPNQLTSTQSDAQQPPLKAEKRMSEPRITRTAEGVSAQPL